MATREAKSSKPPLYCSFCRKPSTDAQKLISGPGVYICDACVRLRVKVLAGKPIPALSGREALSDDALLSTLPASNAVDEDVRGVLQSHVDSLRARDVSWARIGAALGMSRQAAWERFA